MRWVVFLFLIAEFYLASWSVASFGFWMTLLIYWIPTIFGLPLVIFQNQMNWAYLQKQMRSGKIPDQSLLRLLAGFVGSLLMLVPSLAARILSIILLFPPTRYLILFIGRTWIIKKISDGSFKAFSSGKGFSFGGFSSRPGAENQDYYQNDQSLFERDARVIDIEAVKIPSTKVINSKKEPSDQS